MINVTASERGYENKTIASLFDGIAATYDSDTEKGGWRNLTVFRELLGRLSLAPGTVLDLGAGTGGSIEAMLEYAQPERVVAVDASQGMIRQLEQKFPNDAHIVSIHSDVASYLDRRDRETFDLVTAISLMHFMPDHRVVMNGVARRLNRGARFIFTYAPLILHHPTQGEAQVTMPNGVDIFHYATDDVREVVYENGLRVVDEILYTPRPSVDPATIAGMMVVERYAQAHLD